MNDEGLADAAAVNPSVYPDFTQELGNKGQRLHSASNQSLCADYALAGAMVEQRRRGSIFLASDDVEMITGFDLRVDAGAIAKYWPWTPRP